MTVSEGKPWHPSERLAHLSILQVVSQRRGASESPGNLDKHTDSWALLPEILIDWLSHQGCECVYLTAVDSDAGGVTPIEGLDCAIQFSCFFLFPISDGNLCKGLTDYAILGVFLCQAGFCFNLFFNKCICIYSQLKFSLEANVFKSGELNCLTKSVGNVLQILPFNPNENRTHTLLKQLQI